MWDLSSQIGIEPMPPVLKAWSLNHWTTREFPVVHILFYLWLLLGFLQLLQEGVLSSCGAQASHCGGFSCGRAQT